MLLILFGMIALEFFHEPRSVLVSARPLHQDLRRGAEPLSSLVHLCLDGW
jgi:hypothetical protein